MRVKNTGVRRFLRAALYLSLHERDRSLDGGVYTHVAGIEQDGIIGLPKRRGIPV